MTLGKVLKSKPYGSIMVSILEDQGIMELLEGDIGGYFKTYRSISPEIFSDFVKEMFLTDERISAILAEDKLKERYMAITMTDAYYLINSITGLCNQTIKRRITDSPNILKIPGRTLSSILIRPIFTNNEMEIMKTRIINSKIRMNIEVIEDYDSDDIQVITDERYDC